jgi:hypothetical protein
MPLTPAPTPFSFEFERSGNSYVTLTVRWTDGRVERRDLHTGRLLRRWKRGQKRTARDRRRALRTP